jgi:hypothetical protein
VFVSIHTRTHVCVCVRSTNASLHCAQCLCACVRASNHTHYAVRAFTCTFCAVKSIECVDCRCAPPVRTRSDFALGTNWPNARHLFLCASGILYSTDSGRRAAHINHRNDNRIYSIVGNNRCPCIRRHPHRGRKHLTCVNGRVRSGRHTVNGSRHDAGQSRRYV